jgi:4-hydroxybenzoate polyprenyltransferase
MWRSSLRRWQAAYSSMAGIFALAPVQEERRGLATGRRSRLSLANRSAAGRVAVEWLHGLHLFGALGISAFGSAFCAVFEWNHARWVPYWFFGALLVFNLDRAVPDPADQINVPRRRAASTRLRWVSWLLAVFSAGMLIWLPAQQADWVTLVLVIIGAAICAGYSLPLFGRRFKEVPLLKTFFAPSLVVLAILSLPLIHEPWPSHPGLLLFASVWAWGYLLCNMLICDLRDVKGDRLTGVVSLPVRLGRRASYRLLWILIGCTGGLAILLSAFPGGSARLVWLMWGILGSAYIASLAVAITRRRSERFYEWWVEGMLFVPAVAVVVFR